MKKEYPHVHVIEQVPVNYYQKGIKTNRLQRYWHTNKLKAVLSFIQGEPKSVLDVGCASGWFLSEVAKVYKNAKYYGIDVYPLAIEYAVKKYKSISFQVSDAHRLPYKAKTFDLIVCTEVMEHVDDPQLVLIEMKRVLKNKGSAIIELDTGSTLFSVAWFLWRLGKGKVWKDAHVHGFTLKKLERYMKKTGFLIEQKKTFNFGMAVVYRLKKK